MAIAYKYPPTGEIVEKEPWRWVAVFKDGSSLEQFEVKDGQAIFHQFRGEILPRGDLDIFKLIHDSYPEVAVKIPAGAEAVHFYRHREVHELLDQGAETEQVTRRWKLKTWCIGFRIDKTYWLVFVDDLGKAIYTNDKNMFLDNYTNN